jgi:hypothetical protein
MIPDAVNERLAGFNAFNAAGGLNYHLRARRYAKKLWEPFRWSLGEWLLGWTPPERNLLLVGPSAGYNLQPFLFERFERVIVLEPDPIARWLFQRRLARTPLEPRPRLELIGSDHLVWHPERLAPLLEAAAPCAILFSNVLGQLVALVDEEKQPDAFAAIRSAVRAALRGRSWASFHDRVSGPLEPAIATARSEARWSDADVLRHAYATGGGPPLVELRDHSTGGFFPASVPHAYFRWHFDPSYFHLIEAVAGFGSAEPAEVAEGAAREPGDASFEPVPTLG